jgi:hypothetical protein
MKPGDYIWAPELAPAGPMLIIVSLKGQRAYVYRNGIPIGISTISTGRDGYETPTGVFSVLQKDIDHKSNLYDDAPMPFMQRLTWGGVALHAGYVPGRPASHGCIRLPMAFARLLYEVTGIGMTVIVTDSAAVPRVAPMPSFLTKGADAAVAGLEGRTEWHPERAPGGPVSIVISTADRQLLVLRNGVPIGTAPVRVNAEVVRPMAFVLGNEQGRWNALAVAPGAAAGPVADSELAKVELAEPFRQQLMSVLTPGTTVVVTADTLQNGGPGAPMMVLDAEGKQE